MASSVSVWIEVYDRKGEKRSYKVRWRNSDGSRGIETFPNAQMANEFKDNKRLELRAAPHGLTTQSKESFSKFAIKYLRDAGTYKSKETVRKIDTPAISAFVKHAGEIPTRQITSEMVNEWKLKLLEKYRPATVHLWLRCLKAAFNYARIRPNPVSEVKMPVVDPGGRVLTDEEIQKILGLADTETRRAVIFALYTGVRINELLSLTKKDIRRVDGEWEVTVGSDTFQTKTREKRIITLHPMAMEATGIPGEGKIFPLSFDALESRYRKIIKNLNIGRVRFHDLRHTWATRFMEQTGDFFALKKLGGWKDIGSMKVYQHITKDRARAVLSLSYNLWANCGREVVKQDNSGPIGPILENGNTGKRKTNLSTENGLIDGVKIGARDRI